MKFYALEDSNEENSYFDPKQEEFLISDWVKPSISPIESSIIDPPLEPVSKKSCENQSIMMDQDDPDFRILEEPEDFFGKLLGVKGLARHYSIQIADQQNDQSDISIPDFDCEDVLSADDANGKLVDDPFLKIQGVAIFKSK